MSDNAKLYPNYFKEVSHLQSIDVYRVIELWALNHPALQHALKKVLVCGRRGPKDACKDAQEAIDALKRFIEMNQEDERKAQPATAPHDLKAVTPAEYYDAYLKSVAKQFSPHVQD